MAALALYSPEAVVLAGRNAPALLEKLRSALRGSSLCLPAPSSSAPDLAARAKILLDGSFSLADLAGGAKVLMSCCGIGSIETLTKALHPNCPISSSVIVQVTELARQGVKHVPVSAFGVLVQPCTKLWGVLPLASAPKADRCFAGWGGISKKGFGSSASPPKVGRCFAGWDRVSKKGFGSSAGGWQSAAVCLNLDGVVVKPPGCAYCGEKYKDELMKAIENCDQKLNRVILLGKNYNASVNLDKHFEKYAAANVEEETTGGISSVDKLKRLCFTLVECFKWACVIYTGTVATAAVYTTGLSPLEAVEFVMMEHDDNSEYYKNKINNHRERIQQKQTDEAKQKAEIARARVETSMQELVLAKLLADKETDEHTKSIERNDRERELTTKAAEVLRRERDAIDRACEISRNARLSYQSEKSVLEAQIAAYDSETLKVEADIEEVKKRRGKLAEAQAKARNGNEEGSNEKK